MRLYFRRALIATAPTWNSARHLPSPAPDEHDATNPNPEHWKELLRVRGRITGIDSVFPVDAINTQLRNHSRRLESRWPAAYHRLRNHDASGNFSKNIRITWPRTKSSAARSCPRAANRHWNAWLCLNSDVNSLMNHRYGRAFLMQISAYPAAPLRSRCGRPWIRLFAVATT